MADDFAGEYEAWREDFSVVEVEDGGGELVEVDSRGPWRDVQPTEDGLNTLLRRMAGADAEVARCEEWVAAEEAKLRGWLDDRTSGLRRLREVWERSAEQITRELCTADGRKSIVVPAGRVALREPGAPSLEVYAEADAVEVLVAAGVESAVKVVRSVAKSEAKQVLKPGGFELDVDGDLLVAPAVTDAGEVVPGLRFTKPVEARFKAYPGG